MESCRQPKGDTPRNPLIDAVTGRRALVQVKSVSDLKTFLRYKKAFVEMGNSYAEMYFVVHTPTSELAQYRTDAPVFLLTSKRLAELVVSAGLTQWLIDKVS